MSADRRCVSLATAWRIPAALALSSLFGLVSALLGQGGVWWPLSWIALTTPLAVIVFCLWCGGPR